MVRTESVVVGVTEFQRHPAVLLRRLRDGTLREVRIEHRPRCAEPRIIAVLTTPDESEAGHG